MPFPSQRLRRLRLNSRIRERLAETELSARRLIMPFFVCPGRGVKTPIQAMPGQYQRSLDVLVKDIAALQRRGDCNPSYCLGCPRAKMRGGPTPMPRKALSSKPCGG